LTQPQAHQGTLLLVLGALRESRGLGNDAKQVNVSESLRQVVVNNLSRAAGALQVLNAHSVKQFRARDNAVDERNNGKRCDGYQFVIDWFFV
jgi:hypothetical protein